MAKVCVDLLDAVQLVQREAVWVLVLQLFENLDLAVAAADAGVQFDPDQFGVPDLTEASNNLNDSA